MRTVLNFRTTGPKKICYKLFSFWSVHSDDLYRNVTKNPPPASSHQLNCIEPENRLSDCNENSSEFQSRIEPENSSAFSELRTQPNITSIFRT
jgi:hypothetical protein